MAEQKPISRRLRYEILRRDNNTCQYCGQSAPDVKLTVDHVIARALGGSDDPSNLVAACRDCNAGKSSTTTDAATVAKVDERAKTWAAAIEQAAKERRSAEDHAAASIARFDAIWTNWTNAGETLPRQHDWDQSIHRFLGAGLSLADLERLVIVAMKSQAYFHNIWKYFCGCCWREINDRQERALQILEAPSERPDSDAAEDVDDTAVQIEEAYQEGWQHGFEDAESKQRTAGFVGDEAAEIAYERGKNDGITKTLNKWKSEHPEDFKSEAGDTP